MDNKYADTVLKINLLKYQVKKEQNKFANWIWGKLKLQHVKRDVANIYSVPWVSPGWMKPRGTFTWQAARCEWQESIALTASSETAPVSEKGLKLNLSFLPLSLLHTHTHTPIHSCVNQAECLNLAVYSARSLTTLEPSHTLSSLDPFTHTHTHTAAYPAGRTLLGWCGGSGHPPVCHLSCLHICHPLILGAEWVKRGSRGVMRTKLEFLPTSRGLIPDISGVFHRPTHPSLQKTNKRQISSAGRSILVLLPSAEIQASVI